MLILWEGVVGWGLVNIIEVEVLQPHFRFLMISTRMALCKDGAFVWATCEGHDGLDLCTIHGMQEGKWYKLSLEDCDVFVVLLISLFVYM